MNHISLRKTINKRKKISGFRTLMKTKHGCKIIKLRRKKRRKSL